MHEMETIAKSPTDFRRDEKAPGCCICPVWGDDFETRIMFTVPGADLTDEETSGSHAKAPVSKRHREYQQNPSRARLSMMEDLAAIAGTWLIRSIKKGPSHIGENVFPR